MLLSYELTIIEDETVALAGSIPGGISTNNPLILGTSVMAVLIMMMILVAIYMVRLHHYQTRLYELTAGRAIKLESYNTKSIKSVRNQITLAENALVDTDFSNWN